MIKTAYYMAGGLKTPAIIQRKKRVYADVKLLTDVNKRNTWELWEVPIEDLVETNDFKIVSNSITGDVLIWQTNQ